VTFGDACDERVTSWAGIGAASTEVIPNWVIVFRVPNESEVRGEMLSAMGWDLRALGEAQIRSITTMQRCIDDYRKAPDPRALREIRRHVLELDRRSSAARESWTQLLQIVADLEAMQAEAG
jgi:hypothetical protein